MTTQTQTLQDKLTVLNDDQLKAIFAFYGSDALKIYSSLKKQNSSPETFQQELYALIYNSNNSEQKNKLTSLIEKYYISFEGERVELENLAKVAKDAVKVKNDYKKAVNSSIATFTVEFQALIPEANKVLLNEVQMQQAIDEALAYRDSLRQKGKRAYLKAIVASVIDNCEKEYMEEVKKEAEVKVEVAQALIKETDNSTTLKGTKEIINLSFPRTKKHSKSPQVQGARRGMENVANVVSNKPLIKN